MPVRAPYQGSAPATARGAGPAGFVAATTPRYLPRHQQQPAHHRTAGARSSSGATGSAPRRHRRQRPQGSRIVTRALTLDDIMDLRAYERQRDTLRRQVIALKQRRRVAVGPLVTLVFENRDTIRFQIQEMARAEQMTTDAAIEEELAVYNPLIPEPGHLSATLFVELVDEEALRYWLPRLVGIEHAVVFRLADGARVQCQPEAEHEAQLTRADVTAAVHYVHWVLSPQQVEQMAGGPVVLAVEHPEYRYDTALASATVAELLADLRP